MKSAALFLAVALSAAAFATQAQEARPYREGPVTVVTSVKVKPGKFDEYMAYLAGPYRELMEASKKAGNIVGYNVYGTRPRTPNEADLYLTTTYANMAAFDGMEDREAPLMNKVFGSRKQSMQKSADRESMREVIGSELVRELILR